MSSTCNFPIERFREMETPFYYYDLDLLRRTLDAIHRSTANDPNYVVHYAVKANANPMVLGVIAEAGLGADCVSGGEILAAREAGIPGNKIVYSGVGKTDREINIALDNDIYCFNVESAPELEVINELAGKKGKKARIAIRVNPEVGAHTHAHITTGLAENKFGIALGDLEKVIAHADELENVEFIGLHFHIGSQLLVMDDFVALCERVNTLMASLKERGVKLPYINVGGGLGIDYDNPDLNPIPDFDLYFKTYRDNLNIAPDQTLHFELGRAVVAQCGTLISRVVFVKEGSVKKFAIIDAGMTELIRPALYDAHHEIQNLTSESEVRF